MASIPVLTPAEAADWDRRAEAGGVALATLMECAGRAAVAVLADAARARWPAALGTGVLIAAGPGNNGGDGWVMARALHRLGVPVWVAPLAGEPSPLNAAMRALARAEGVREVAPDGPWPSLGLVVDAILGTGARGAPRPPAAALLDRLADLRLPLLAVDGPTGLDLATGVVHGAPRADVTVTFGGLRRGHLLARDEVGEVVVVDIGLPDAAPGLPTLVTDAQAAAGLPAFRAEAHKGDRGRVVLVGGAAGMSGAIRMAGRGAFGAGAGLAHAVAPAETVAALVQAEPDLQTLAHPLAGPVDEALAGLLARADAVAIGPGLGRAPERRAFVEAVVGRVARAVLDADALTVFQGAVDRLAALADGRALVLTPHPGEFRTLFPDLAAEREVDPWGAACTAAERVGATVLLKGVPTVVARPGRALLTVAAGNPGLATGGSGDLLSGITVTFLAQGLEPERAAALGAQVLGRAADLAARAETTRAMRPADVVAALPALWREWDILRERRPPVEPPVLARLEAPLHL
ncbi:MAG TPA: NAD(P)H-hydrate dehydratase [Gemmatimonadales bacterium]|nr:NAD(P)H-hydrate dehydratase [Gemmatimonadales bacterium]